MDTRGSKSLLWIPLSKETFFSLALPDGNGLQINGNVRDKYLICHGISRMPIICARTRERSIDLRFGNFSLLNIRRIVVVIVMTMMSIYDSG